MPMALRRRRRTLAETDPLDDQELSPEGDGLSGEGVVADTTGDSDGDGLSDAEEG